MPLQLVGSFLKEQYGSPKFQCKQFDDLPWTSTPARLYILTHIAIDATSACPHEVTLVEDTLDACFLNNVPTKIIGDMAYDSDGLDERLAKERGVELIAPHKSNRVKSTTQDGRVLRRYKKRWKVERFFAWLQNFRRLVVRYEYHLANFLAMVQLGCIVILLRKVLG